MVPFFKKNTLEQTKFEMTSSGFTYVGINYSFDDVVEVAIYRHVLQRKMVGMSVAVETHSISVSFWIKTGERVQLTEQPTWVSESKYGKVERIHEIYEIVSAQTFQSRLKKYVDQVQSAGFFEYSGWRFFPEEQKLVLLEKQKAYSVRTSKFLRSYGFVEVVNDADGVAAKLRRTFVKRTGINTLHDADVFFALLKHYFRLEWK